MKKTELINSPALSNMQSKDNQKFENDLQKVFNYLQGHTASATMVTTATSIPQKSVTRYKRQWEKLNLLWVICKKRCVVTGRIVGYLTTNPDLIPHVNNRQLNIFDNE
jgi:hypothetical protein